MKIKTWLRNLTTDVDLMLNLPVKNLNEILDANCEYIITDCTVLDPSEFDSITELNNFLEYCEENEINKDDLEILSRLYSYEEVRQIVVDGKYIIVDFEAETADWYGGSGGDLWNDSHKGMCLFDGHYYNPFNFEINENIYEWIDWEQVWRNANTDGWQSIYVYGNGYLVYRWER